MPAKEKLTQYQDAIRETDGELGAFLYHPDQPLLGEEGKPLSDLVVAIKDNIFVKDWPVTAASKILEGHIAAYDATVVRKLKEAGATIIGKTNLDEFAMGASTETSAYKVTKNPWDKTKVSGGSSGGSAVAVAAGMCDVALGSDTGGSVRQPAAFCGITGMKPTYGTVSRYGLIALASSLDQIGPFGHSAEEVERIYEVISGKDPLDQTTVDYRYEKEDVDIKGLRIGLVNEHWDLTIDDEYEELKNNARGVVKFLESKGAVVKKISLPHVKYAIPVYYVILPAEACANLARYDGVRYRKSEQHDGQTLLERYLETRANFGPEVKRRILIGTFVLSHGHYDAYYQTAVKVRQLMREEYRKAFEEVDIMIDPTSPFLPFDIGSRIDDPLKMYQADLLTCSLNLTGLPGLVIPSGKSRSGLPTGAQLVAPWFKESRLLSIAKQYQAETSHHKGIPDAR